MLIIFFIVGLIFGSFLNVVIYRLDMAESLMGRSYCRHCKAQIAWYDNIPFFSFLVLKGRCRDCEKKISWQYPAVEVATGIIFAVIGYIYFDIAKLESWAVSGYFLGIMSALVVIFVYDLLYMEIPGLVLWPAIGWTIAFNLFFDWNKDSIGNNIFNSAIYSGALGGFLAFMFFFILATISKEKWMGMGDAQLAILLGLALGWPKILLGLMLAFAIGAIVGIALILLKKKKMQSQIPFAPFLILGSVLALAFYTPVINWYMGMF